ncbi:tetratricopeptide repeat protein [bacterium]|nr:tetratricopeptide repeat protein [bacterium]
MTKAFKYLVFPLLLLAILLAYYPSVASSYHLDDFEIIVANDLVDAKLIPLIKKYPTRWLVFLSYWLSLRPAVTDVVGKVFTPESARLVSLHLFNFFLHALNSWLVYLISLPLLLPLRLRDKIDKASLGVQLSAALIAFFFALIPLQTMPVIYIGQRFTLFSAFFYLLTLYFVTRAYFAHWRKAIAIPCAVISFVIGLFCKETIVTAPVACIVLLWLFEASPELKYLKSHQKKYLILELLGVIFLFLVLPAVVFCHLNKWDPELIMGSLKSVGGMRHIDYNVEGLSRLTYFLTQPFVILFYVALFFMPGLLCIDHDIPLCTSFLSWQWIVPVCILLACCVVFFKVRHKYPLASFGFFFFIFPLLPQSSFMPTLDLAFEHRMYLSVAGLIWIFADLLRIMSESLPKAFTYAMKVCLPAALLLYAAATYQRSKVWQTERTIWGDAMTKAGGKQRVMINYASAYMEETGDHAYVIDLLSENMPKWHIVHPRAFAVLGSAYQLAGEMKYAINNYLSAIDSDKDNPLFRYNIAILYLSTGKPDKALGQLNRMIELNPDYADGYYLRGVVNRYMGRNKSAKKDFEKYLSLSPNGENCEEAKEQLKALNQQ